MEETKARNILISDLDVDPEIVEELSANNIRSLQNLLDSMLSTTRYKFLSTDELFNILLKSMGSNYTLDEDGNYLIKDASLLSLKKR